jgi:cell division protease FtsH
LLIEREVIFAEDLETIFGKRPWTSRQDELIAQNGEAEIAEEIVETAEKKNSENTSEQATEKKREVEF